MEIKLSYQSTNEKIQYKNIPYRDKKIKNR